MIRRRSVRACRRAFTALALACVLTGWTGAVRAADPAAEDVGTAREILGKWVETRRIISKERSEWNKAREILTERVDLIQSEIKSVRKQIAEAKARTAESDEKLAELRAANDRLAAAADELRETVTKLEVQTKALLARLPESIRADVEQFSGQFPEAPEETTLGLGLRFQNVVGVLNQLNKRNVEITVETETHDLPDGKGVRVKVLYLGLGQAFYVKADGSLAGYGTATEEGWRWTSAGDAADAVADAIAILENEKVASYVRLPVNVK